MNYKTKVLQQLDAIETDVHEQLLLYGRNESAFLANVRQLRKPALEALVYVSLVNVRQTVPPAADLLTVADIMDLLEQNHLQLCTDRDRLGYLLNALALRMLHANDSDTATARAAAFVAQFERELSELPMFYDVLRIVLTMAIERDEYRAAIGSLDVRKMVHRLPSESLAIHQQSLACLRLLTQLDGTVTGTWLDECVDRRKGTFSTKQRIFMLCHLIDAVLDGRDNRTMELLISSDDCWKIVLEGLEGDSLCRKGALLIVRNAVSFCTTMGAKFSVATAIFQWNGKLSAKGFPLFFTIVESLNEYQSHLILPALEQLHKSSTLNDCWMDVLIKLIIGHENAVVARYGFHYLLEYRCFNEKNLKFERQFLTFINEMSRFDDIERGITLLHDYYCTPPAFCFLLQHLKDVSWASLPFYCVVQVITRICTAIDHTGGDAILPALLNSIDICLAIKNVDLRNIIACMILEQISNVVLHMNTPKQDRQLATQILEKVEPLAEKCPTVIKALNTAGKFVELFNSCRDFAFLERRLHPSLIDLLRGAWYEFSHSPQENFPLYYQACLLRARHVDPQLRNDWLANLTKSTISPDDLWALDHMVRLNGDEYDHRSALYNVEQLIYNTDTLTDVQLVQLLSIIPSSVHYGVDLWYRDKVENVIDTGDVEMLRYGIKYLAPRLKVLMDTDEEYWQPIVDRCYAEIQVQRKSAHYMKLMKSFVDMILGAIFVPSCVSPDEFVDYIPYALRCYLDILPQQVGRIAGLAIVFYERILTIPPKLLLNWSSLVDLLLQGILMGQVPSREQRLENEAVILGRLNTSIDDTGYRFNYQNDTKVRVLCVQFLYRIAEVNHPDGTLFLLKLEKMLIEKFLTITKEKERYHANSLTHRYKLRIVQALCVLLKLTGTKPYALLDVLLYETNQPNIHYLIELIVADSTIETLTIIGALQNKNVKVSGVQSIIVILWLRCCKTNVCEDGYINLLLPWTMGSNFATRLYAQITITKLIKKFHRRPGTGPFGKIYKAINGYIRAGNVERNLKKCMNDFRFNRLLDYSNLLTLENIFHNIPRVSKMAPEDIADTALLQTCAEQLDLVDLNLGEALEFESFADDQKDTLFISQPSGGADYIQRKIVPLKCTEVDAAKLETLPENVWLRKTKNCDGLILVASLVSRPPNLGGLARTGEVFAVSQFIVNSLMDVQNKEFCALSMTAEKWLNIAELKVHDIRSYLWEMKMQGYTVVGAEQTTGSKPIQEVQFPKKSILVLGHEKEGLPANIIRMLDLVVEIPQFGVVRSLNAHVTGAIFMWEYAKQHLVAQVPEHKEA